MAEQSQNTSPTMTPEEAEIRALVIKHRAKIDKVLLLDPAEQRTEFTAYGIDPDEVRKHYKHLFDRDAELDKREEGANKKAAMLGWGSAIAALGVWLAPFLKGGESFRTRVADSKLVQGFIIGITTFMIGVFGSFTGSKLFISGIRRESKALTLEVRDAFEKELAIAMENKDREAQARTYDEPSASGFEANSTTRVEKKTPPQPRDANYTAQAAVEKSAAAIPSIG